MIPKSRNLVLVSENRLQAEATGAALVCEGAVDSYRHVRNGLDDQHLQAFPAPAVIVLDERSHADVSQLFSKIRRIAHALPGAGIVVIGDGDSPQSVAGCIASGASTYVLNGDTLSELATTIKVLQEGNSRCSAMVLDVVLRRIRELATSKHTDAESETPVLTPREIEVLELVEMGLLNKEIASRLNIAVSTVKNHLHAIFEKFQVSERRQAVRHGIAIGVLSCGRKDAVA